MGSENLTHAERQALGYGTAKERLGKDSIKDFDACSLCLQPVQVLAWALRLLRLLPCCAQRGAVAHASPAPRQRSASQP